MILKSIPKDQFSHAYYLISNDDISIDEFTNLINKHVLLSNIDNDRIMRLYQNDVHFLVNLFELQKRDNSLTNLFNVLYTSWVFEVSLTRTKKGMERQLQAFVNQVQNLQGFGHQIYQEQKEQEKNKQNIIGGINYE